MRNERSTKYSSSENACLNELQLSPTISFQMLSEICSSRIYVMRKKRNGKICGHCLGMMQMSYNLLQSFSLTYYQATSFQQYKQIKRNSCFRAKTENYRWFLVVCVLILCFYLHYYYITCNVVNFLIISNNLEIIFINSKSFCKQRNTLISPALVQPLLIFYVKM